jgi:hypothetical protein
MGWLCRGAWCGDDLVPSFSFWANLVRVSHVVAALAVVQLLVFGLLASRIPLSGDEVWYFDTSKLILPLVSRAVRFDFHGAKEILATIIDRGWFMPGMSIIMAPVTFFTDSVAIVRLYVGALNFAAVAAILFYLQKGYGGRGPPIYLLCCLVVPYYLIYCFTIWGDLLAAHLLLCLLLLIFHRRNGSRPPGLAFATAIGVALGMMTMVRGFYWGFAPLFAALFVFGTPAREPLSVRLRLAAAPSCALLLGLAAVLAPWTAGVTRLYGFHITTTSTTASRIILIGSDEYFSRLEQDPCGYPVSTLERDITGLDNYIRCRANRERRSYAEQSRLELASAIAAASYADKVHAIIPNVRKFLFDSEAFLNRFARISNPSPDSPTTEWRSALFEILMKLNHWGWRALLTIGILLFVTPMAPSTSNLFLSTVYKYSVVLYSTHPFMVDAHGRYYVEYIPMIAVAIAAFASTPQPLLARKLPGDSLAWLVIAGQVIALLAVPALAIAYLAAA